jgi:DNA-binding MarR family transcriptional regulator
LPSAYHADVPEQPDRSSILFDLFATSQRVRSLLVAAMADAGLGPDDYAVYSGVFEFGPISPTDLAAVVGMPATTVSHYIRAMRERGHIHEAPHPVDGRSRTITLTPRGRRAHRRANGAFEEAYRRFMAGIRDPDATRATLREIEEAATAALGELRRDATAEAG